MERFIVCETDKGHIAVRPLSWVGVWNERGQIEETLNHTALFNDKEEAEKFAEWKNAEEQGLLLKLPCKVGDTIWCIKKYSYCPAGICHMDISCSQCRKKAPWTIKERKFRLIDLSEIGKTVFLTQEEAEEALRKMNETENF